MNLFAKIRVWIMTDVKSKNLFKYLNKEVLCMTWYVFFIRKVSCKYKTMGQLNRILKDKGILP